MSFQSLWILSAFLQTVLFFIGWKMDITPFLPVSRLPDERDPGDLPPAALFIPLTGHSAEMEAALHSLLRQDYPRLSIFLATHGDADPARNLALKLAEQYPHARHIVAGKAEQCGQKNRNLLDSLAAAPSDTAIYVFCDANHTARPDFIRQLTRPIIQKKACFCAGYRRSRLYDHTPATVAFHALNRFMLLLQSLPVFTQPWGGALAVSAAAFRELNVKDLWAHTVVDDSSLAGLLIKKDVRTVFCPNALLESSARAVSGERLDAWFLRQLLYPKFYTFGVWLLIGAALLWFTVTSAASMLVLMSRLTECTVPDMTTALAMAHLGLLALLQELLRRRIAPGCPRPAWLKGLSLAIWKTHRIYCRTILARELVWHGLRYSLSAKGSVISVIKVEKHTD